MYLLYSVLSPSCSGDRIRASVCDVCPLWSVCFWQLVSRFPSDLWFSPSIFPLSPPSPFCVSARCASLCKGAQGTPLKYSFFTPFHLWCQLFRFFLEAFSLFFITRTHLFGSPLFFPFLLPVLKFSQIGFLCFCLLGSSHFGAVSWGTTLSVHCLFCYNAFLTLFFVYSLLRNTLLKRRSIFFPHTFVVSFLRVLL